MLEHVWERASQSRYLTSVVIATDDERVRDAAESFKARVIMTRDDHVSGTDRVAEAASASDADWVVNIQGDEPTLDPTAIDSCILSVMGSDIMSPDESGDRVVMGTLKVRIPIPELARDPNIVKVVTDSDGNAIYFSRSPIPYRRPDGDPPTYFKHIGLYVYRRDFLLGYSDLPIGPLEKAERLEQLRALENGYKIRVVETEYDSLGVDTPEDWQQVRQLFERTALRPETEPRGQARVSPASQLDAAKPDREWTHVPVPTDSNSKPSPRKTARKNRLQSAAQKNAAEMTNKG